jgi:hypothetical protein
MIYVVYARDVDEYRELGRFKDVQVSGGALVCINASGEVSKMYGVGEWAYVARVQG